MAMTESSHANCPVSLAVGHGSMQAVRHGRLRRYSNARLRTLDHAELFVGTTPAMLAMRADCSSVLRYELTRHTDMRSR